MRTMSTYENRRTNLRALVEQWGGPLPLSKKLGYKNASFISQMSGPHPTREVTEKSARRIEQKLGLPAGWMDTPSGAPLAPALIDISLLARIVRIVAQTAEDEKIVLSPDKLGDVVALVYSDAEPRKGEVDPAFINRVLRLTQ
jgi:hypothetical protein